MKKLVVGMLMIGIVTMVAGGCASTGGEAKGPSDADLLKKAVADWKAAGVAKNMDALIACYSDDFQHYEYGDKAGLQQFLKDALSMGYLEGVEIDETKAQNTITKDTAVVAPIAMKAAFGEAAISLNFKKEAAGWKIVSMDVEMN